MGQSEGVGGTKGGTYGGQSVFDFSNRALIDAANATSAGMVGNKPQNFAAATSPYMNAYTDQVIGRTVGDINEQRDRAINQAGANAAMQNAYGGARHGLVESQIYDNALDTVADASARLRHEGFNTAGDLANSAYYRNLGGAQNLSNLAMTGFNMGNTLQDNLYRSGFSQDAIGQAMLDASQGMFGNYVNQPQNALQLMLSAMSGIPYGSLTNQVTTSPRNSSGALQGIGSLFSGLGSLAVKSSIRYKTNVHKDVRPPVADKIEVYKYRYTDGPSHDVEYGFIAEELAEVLPEAVGFDNTGRPQYVKAVPLIAELFKTVKAQQKRIDELEEKIHGTADRS